MIHKTMHHNTGFIDWLDRQTFLEREFLRDLWRNTNLSWESFLYGQYLYEQCVEV